MLTVPPSLFARYTTEDKEEKCGLIYYDENHKHCLAELKNSHENSLAHFRINNNDVMDFLLHNPKAIIVGIYHTHNLEDTEEPSNEDMDKLPQTLFGIVYHPLTMTITWYDSHGIIKSISIKD